MPTSRGGRQVYQNLVWYFGVCRVQFLPNFFFFFLKTPQKVGLGVVSEDKRVAQVLNTYVYYLMVMT